MSATLFNLEIAFIFFNVYPVPFSTDVRLDSKLCQELNIIFCPFVTKCSYFFHLKISSTAFNNSG